MSSKIKLSIGMPVYNCEKSIGKAIDSLLNQTFVDFELIISDNASTDSTSEICKEYAKKDGRIRYIRQSRNMGIIWNFLFVLQEAKCKYFQWAAADDLWLPEFLKKNIDILEANDNVVGSISDVVFYDDKELDLSSLKSQYPSIKSTKYQHVYPAYGSYEKKIAVYLRLRQSTGVYAVFRTDKLRLCANHNRIEIWDFVLLLSILKHGDFHVLDEVLMYRHSKGESGTKTNIELMKELGISIPVIIFPTIPFTIWCARQFGTKIFMKNFIWIARFLCQGEIQFIFELIRLCKKQIRNTRGQNNE